MAIKIVKLCTNEDIIGEIEKIEEIDFRSITQIKIKKPAVLHMIQTEEGVGMMMIPFMPFSKNKEFVFEKNSIVTTADPDINILNEYNNKFGSGIVVPDKNIEI